MFGATLPFAMGTVFMGNEKMMNDLISRQAALDEFQRFGSVWMEYTDDMPAEKIAWMALKNAKSSMIDVLNGLPTVDAEPAQYGHWYIQRFGSDAKCSECGMSFTDAYDIENHDKYCRHCGARMLGIAVKEWK